jgi:hypothetical protein
MWDAWNGNGMIVMEVVVFSPRFAMTVHSWSVTHTARVAAADVYGTKHTRRLGALHTRGGWDRQPGQQWGWRQLLRRNLARNGRRWLAVQAGLCCLPPSPLACAYKHNMCLLLPDWQTARVLRCAVLRRRGLRPGGRICACLAGCNTYAHDVQPALAVLAASRHSTARRGLSRPGPALWLRPPCTC